MKEFRIIFYFLCLLIIVSFFWYNWIYRRSVFSEARKIGVSLPKKVLFILIVNIVIPLISGIAILLMMINQILKEGF